VLLAHPAASNAADPAFGTATCTVQSVTMMTTVWQIKGVTSVTNLPPGMTFATVTVKFEKRANGAMNLANFLTVMQTSPSVNGTAQIDTGFQSLTPAPASGDQYRISVSGYYTVGMDPPVNLTGISSLAITPVP